MVSNVVGMEGLFKLAKLWREGFGALVFQERRNKVTWYRMGALGGLIFLMACGPGEAPYGAYTGTLSYRDVEGTLTFMEEVDHVLYVAPGKASDVTVRLRNECAVAATWTEGSSFTFSGESCEHTNTFLSLDVEAEGSGQLDESGNLTVTYTLRGTIQRTNQEELTYESTATFTEAP